MNCLKTPLRYPGGKQRLSPFIKEILAENHIEKHYVEPFAGGAGVAIELLLTRKVEHIHLNDSYIGIYAFWHSVINETDRLCNKIDTASLTIDEWKYRRSVVKELTHADLFELGYSVFYLNRCNRSGILSGGVIGGLEQIGDYKMDARFSRYDLIRRIEAIGVFKNSISISNFDAEDYIDNYIPNLPENTLIYLDPPYFNKSNKLYLNSYNKQDHTRLSRSIQDRIMHKWILSYDGVPEIIDLYKDKRHFLYYLQYTAAKVYKGREVFVFCDNLKLPRNCSLKNIETGLKNLINV